MTRDVRTELALRLGGLTAAGVEFVPRTATKPIPMEALPIPDELQSSVGDPVEGRRLALETLAERVAACRKCPELFSSRTQTVFGVGPLDPIVCFVGEAPGADEDRRGEPFVGAAGMLLNKIMAAAGLSRDEVYICNTLKCRPPNNRKPEAGECRNCRPFFDEQLTLVRPKAIVCLGGVAANNVLGNQIGITRLRGRWAEFNGVPVMCTYHPSYLLRAVGTPDEKKLKGECWEDIKQVMDRVGRPVPEKAKPGQSPSSSSVSS